MKKTFPNPRLGFMVNTQNNKNLIKIEISIFEQESYQHQYANF